MRTIFFGGTFRSGVLCAVLLAGMAAVGVARGDEGGITVVGTGSAKSRPTQVEIECTLSGEAELAADATVKFRDAKKRAVAQITGMKNADLSVASEGISVGSMIDANAQMMINRGQSVASIKPRVQVVERERIVLANVEKMEPEALLDMVLKILDVAKDAGFQVGQVNQENYYNRGYRQQAQGTVVSFKLPDSTVLRDKAYKEAFEEAKEKATKLAELSGVKLGRVMAINEQGGGRQPRYYNGEMIGGDDKSISGSSAAELPLTLSLSVQFEIVK